MVSTSHIYTLSCSIETLNRIKTHVVGDRNDKIALRRTKLSVETIIALRRTKQLVYKACTLNIVGITRWIFDGRRIQTVW